MPLQTLTPADCPDLAAYDNAGELIGHAEVVLSTPRRAYVDVNVQPEQRRHGLGSRLLHAALTRARALPAEQIVAVIPAEDRAGEAFLRRHGFAPAGHDRMFDAPADTPLAETNWPDGYTLQSLAELGDLEALAAACNRCRADLWSHMEYTQPLTAAWFAERIARLPDYYPPAGTWVLFAPGGDPAGVNFCRLGDPDPTDPARRTRILDAPAIAPAYRHLDLLRPLVLHGMRWLAAQAAGPYRLETWGDPDSAVAVYRALGFTLDPHNHWVEYWLRA